MIGEILGFRYELLEVVGEGGMAIVYKAKDRKLNRNVAIKVLKKEFSDNTEIAQKFKIEATAIANLSHANIVNVLDVGHEEENNVQYFVMEYVAGKTLKELIEYNGKVSYSTAMNITLQIAKALSAAHHGNVIHRDIKPENILINEGGEVKVTDFGIAKSSTTATITNTTTIMGSAYYLSPEQAKGSFVDIRTDIYSLGVVMYEMVTGRLPYNGESPVTIALKHIQQELIPPKQINSSIPESVNSLIVKAMSKDPLARYQTCKELIVDIEKIKDNPDVVLNNIQNTVSDKTIIMSSITEKEFENKKESQKISREKYIEDMYNDEEDDNEYNEKNYKPLIYVLIALVLVGISFFIGTKLFNEEVPEIKEAIVPNLIDTTYDEAMEELDKLGIDVKIEITEETSEKEVETIIDTKPKSGSEIKEGETIILVISSGIEKIKVPDLSDREINYIKTYLTEKEFKYEITEMPSDDVEVGYIISQSPEKDMEVEKGSIIKLVVSTGPEIKLVKVPNLKGYTVEEATKKLEELNLVIDAREKLTDRDSENGIIIEQPTVDSTVEEGTPIVVFYGKYTAPKIDISIYITNGMKLSQAINTLNLYDISYEISGGSPQDSDLDKYKVKTFTKEIVEGGVVTITIEKIPNTEADDSEEEDGAE